MQEKNPFKVVFLTYYYRPCNLTAANRVGGWMEYMHTLGIRPVIITRSWEHPISSERDVLLPAGKKVEIVQTEEGEVHYVPFKPNLRDRLFLRQGKFARPIRKMLTFMERILGNSVPSLNPGYDIGNYVLDFLKKDKEVDLLVVSANPFQLFFYGHLANKRYRTPWLADYRDDWTSNELQDRSSFASKIFFRLDRKYEKKWLQSAMAFSSVSDYYVRKIQKITGRPGITLMNGYNGNCRQEPTPKNTVFTLLYSGSLYTVQPLEAFIKELCYTMQRIHGLKWKMIFLGIRYNQTQYLRVLKAIPPGFNHCFELLPRVNIEEALEVTAAADVLIMLGYGNLKGIPTSKLFDYLAVRKPVVLYPDDKDIIHKVLEDTGAGHSCSSLASLSERLFELASDWLDGKPLPEPKMEAVAPYSRKEQTSILVKFFRELLPGKENFNVLVLCNDYPPLNTIAAERPYSWGNYFPQLSVGVTIVTKDWQGEETDPGTWRFGRKKEDIASRPRPLLTEIRVPHNMTPSEWFIKNLGPATLSNTRKLLTVIWNFLSYRFLFFDRHRNIFFAAERELKRRPYQFIIATGNPWQNFVHAAKLSSLHNVPWVADYRDGWYLNQETFHYKGFLHRAIRNYEWSIEKKIVPTANYIVTTNPVLSSFYNFLFNRKVHTIFNGFRDLPPRNSLVKGNVRCLLVHNGTLKYTQRIEFLLDALQMVIHKHNLSPSDIELRMVGLEHFPTEVERIRRYAPQIAEFVTTSERLPREESLQIAMEADALIAVSDPAFQNIYAKVYDYLLMKAPIWVVPDDGGIMGEMVANLNRGRSFSDLYSLVEAIENLVFYSINEIQDRNDDKIQNYSRIAQAQKYYSLLKNGYTPSH